MERIGVAAVVDGLSGFLGDMGKMDNSIRSLISPTNILGSTFNFLGGIISNLVGGVFRTLEYALGTLIASAVQFVVGQIKELISATIEAGSEFQTLSLRLNTLNFNDLTEDEKALTNAQAIAIEQTKEQLSWLQKIAAQTPYDNADISKLYTLARGYNFTDEAARGLTETIIDFTSGMGLGNVEMVRIIKNFGQMQQLGKVTQRELNDLAVGAFVPVNDVLAQMRLNTGLAGDEFNAFRSSGEGVQMFLEEFTKLVDRDFQGSAQKMAKTFGAATDNLKDFIKSIGGLNIVKPILDVLGGRIAAFMDELTSEDRWDQIVGLAERIGGTVSGIVSDIMDLAPDAEGMADSVVDALDNIADWLDTHRDDIVSFVQESARWFREDLLPVINQVWDFLFGSEGEKGAIQKFGDWLKTDFLPFIQNQVIPGVMDLINAITGKKNTKDPTKDVTTREDVNATPLENVVAGIGSLATALPAVLDLLSAIGSVIAVAFGGDETQTFAEFVTNTLIPGIQTLTTIINENREGFANLLKLFVALEIIGYITGLVLSLVTGFIALSLAVGTLAVISAIIAAVIVWIKLLQFWWNWATGNLKIMIDSLVRKFTEWKENVTRVFDELGTAIKNRDWAAAGKAIIDGIWRGIKNNWYRVIDLAKQLGQNALNAFNAIFQTHSPSEAMWDIGNNLVKGLAQGVSDSAGIAIRAMSQTAGAVLAAATPSVAYTAAMTAPSQSTYQTTNNFNASFNSNTNNESLVQDFGMMQSLVSG